MVNHYVIPDGHLQPVGGPTGGAQSWSAWPEGGDHLGSSALKTAERPMRRLETSLDGKHLLGKGPRGVGRDFCTNPSSLVAASLDGLAGGKSMTRKELCARKRKTFVLTDEGSVFAFGWMGFGSLGFPDRGSSDKVMQPRVLDSLSGHYVSQISTGLYHTVAVTNKGIVFGFGDNERAQLGQEFIRGCLKPTEIMFDKSSIEDIAISATSG